MGPEHLTPRPQSRRLPLTPLPPDPWWVNYRGTILACLAILLALVIAIALMIRFAIAQGQAAAVSATATAVADTQNAMARSTAQSTATVKIQAVATSSVAASLATVAATPEATPTSLARTVAASPTPSARSNPTPNPVAGEYKADFTKWATGDRGEPYPAHLSFDVATHEYHIALSDASRPYDYLVYEPEPKVFQNFRLDVDMHRTAGPDHGSYGVLLGVQARAANDTTNPRYNVLIDPDDQHFSVNRVPGNGYGEVVGQGTSPAIKQGSAVNHLQVVGQGDAITLSINGQPIGSFAGSMTTSGQIGLILLSPAKPTGPIGIASAFSDLIVASSATEKG